MDSSAWVGPTLEDILRLKTKMTEIEKAFEMMKTKVEGVQEISKSFTSAKNQITKAADAIKHDENNVRALIKSIDIELDGWEQALQKRASATKQKGGA